MQLRFTAVSIVVGGSLLLLGAISPELIGSETTAPPAPTVKPTYAEGIAPILNKHCVECHRPGEVAPFSLVGYDNARKWSPMIAQVVKTGLMPPWKAEHGYGEFLDENRLSNAQIDAILQWSASGAPRGDRAKEPTPPKFTSDWALGEPDLVLQPKRPYKLEAEGADVYRNFVIKTDFKEPVFVTAMAIRPGNPKIVHHVIAFIDRKGVSQSLEAKSKDGQEGYSSFGGIGFLPDGSLGGWAPGVRARHSAEGTGIRLEPGASIVLQIHYNKSGKEEEDLTKVGLYLAKKPVEKEMQLAWIFNFGIDIPPGEPSYKAQKEFTVPRDVTVYGVMPHMHLLGRSMKAWAKKPDGEIVKMVHVPDWDFNWQLQYAYRQPIKLPRGTKVYVEAIYDNSADNPRNPSDPPKRVTWGEQTTDEMFLMVMGYTFD